MQITEIVVSAGRTFNHPHEQYSNLRPNVTVKAILQDGDDWIETTKRLQAQAEQLIEDHKNHMLQSIEDLYELTERQRELVSLESSIRKAQTRLDQIRNAHPQLSQLQIPAEAVSDDEDLKTDAEISSRLNFYRKGDY